MKNIAIITAISIVVLVNTARGQTSYPMIMSLEPVAAQVGNTSEHTIHSRYTMYGASQVFVTGEGVSGEIVHPEKKEADAKKPPNLQAMKVRFTVADDAVPGVRDFRILTPNGASTLGQLVIARDAVVVETKDNNTGETAQSIDVPATICGAIEKAEDVDYFKFSAQANTSLTFHVRSMRLQNKIHDLQQHSDPILTLRSATGSTLATSDNYFYGDPFFDYRFEHDGEYLLEIRDVRYQGNKYWQYSIEVNDQPFVTNVFPLAVPAGQATKLQMVGFQLAKADSAEVALPMDQTCGPMEIPVNLPSAATNPVSLIVSDLPLCAEIADENNTLETAHLVTVPTGINGRIESPADVDCFAFEAKKGDRYSFEVIARRQSSALDSHLRILDAKGKQLTLNDDLRLGKRNSSDSWIENWASPADGKFFVEVRDLHLRGGDRFVYFLRVTKAEPYFELYVDTDKTLLAPGTHGVIFVRAVKKNGFAGEIDLHIDGLPEGVTASCGKVIANKYLDGCIVLTPKNDATPALANVTIRGTATIEDADGKPREIDTVALPYQETYQPGGGRAHYPSSMHTVAIGTPSDIRAVTLSSNDITLKPGESTKIDVKIERAEGFDKNVSLDVVFQHLSATYGNSLPDGVTLDAGNSKILLTKGADEGYIMLKAADDAKPVTKQQICVMANVSLNFVMKATYGSEPMFVSVVK